MYTSVSELLYVFFVLAFMLAITYFTTKFIAKSYGTSAGRKTKMFNIIDRIHLNKDSALLIVKVGEKVVLLGVTPQNINKICDLDENDLNQNFEDISTDQMTFTDALHKNIKSIFVKEENKDFDEK